jgi:tRNA modification GTPase
MYQLKNPEDTIAAILTPAGQGGVGVVRLSGKRALSIAEAMFVARNRTKISSMKSFTVRYGDVVKPETGETVDEALLTVMRAPKSYTKEDVVEISCHGGRVSVRAVLTLALDLGARLAEPGEFTMRAFLNGRIDLAQAEAVLDVVQAKTDAFLRVSAHQLKGDLSTELEGIRGQLMDVYLTIEAAVNFPEDDTTSEGQEKLSDGILAASRRVEVLLRSGEQGRILKEGIKVVLCGKANVGKSSLLNALLKTPRAIVSDIAGTTRDTIEETAQIKGIPFQVVDTAGILEPRDLIEEEAIKRSHLHIAGADLVLFIVDAGRELTGEDENLIRVISRQDVVVVFNKRDLPQKVDEQRIKEAFGPAKVVKISALNRLGIDDLETAIVENVWHDQKVGAHGPLVSNVRHVDALKKCRESLIKAEELARDLASLEFVSEEIKTAVNFLDNITGKNIDADLLENIFSRFCVGK